MSSAPRPKKDLTRLHDLDAVEISLVPQGANRRRFLILKTAAANLIVKGGPGSGPQSGHGAGKSGDDKKSENTHQGPTSAPGDQKKPGWSHLKSLSHSEHSEQQDVHQAHAEAAHAAGDHERGEFHDKMSSVHNDLRYAASQRASANGPYAKAMSTEGRKNKREAARTAEARAKETHASIKKSADESVTKSVLTTAAKKAGGAMAGNALHDMIAKANPEVMAKVDGALKAYCAKIQKDGEGDAAQEMGGLDEQTQAALKAVVRILVPFKEKISPLLLHEVLELAGFETDDDEEEEDVAGEVEKGTWAGNQAGGSSVEKGFAAIPEKVESEKDDIFEGVKKGHIHEAADAANTAYEAHLQKLGYEKYPAGEIAMKTKDGMPVKKSKGEQVTKSADDLSRVDPETRAKVEQIYKTNQELVAKAAALESKLAEQSAAVRKKEIVAKASTWTHLGLPQDDVVANLVDAEKIGTESYERVCKSYDALNAQAKSGDLFKERGSSGSGNPADPWARIEQAAVGHVAKSGGGNLSKAEAVEAYIRTPEGQKLYAEYKAARGGV